VSGLRVTAARGGFVLPVETATETLAILAKKRTGKSNTAVVMAEEMFTAGVQWVAVDPKGDWYGMRANFDGTGPGLPIPVFGGLHGDVDLVETSGALMADLVVDRGLTCILDVSRFESKAAQARFLRDFAHQLYRRHQEHPSAIHLFLDEADEFLPQVIAKDQSGMAACVGAWIKLVKLGGAFGIGVTLITQRAATLNKSALTQIETLIVHRTPAKLDKDAIAGWLGEKDAQADILPTLSTLEQGEAWVVSPHFLGATRRVQMRRRSTFDSGATPKVGERVRRAPATLADIDVAELEELLAATVETARANDPKALRARIRELETELAAADSTAVTVERVEVPVVDEQLVQRLEDRVAGFVEDLSEVTKTLTGVEDGVGELTRQVGALAEVAATGTPAGRQRPDPELVRRAPVPAPSPRGTRSGVTADGAVKLKAGARRMLGVLGWAHPRPLTHRELGLLADIASSGGTYTTYLGHLTAAGYVTTHGGTVALTDTGYAAAPVTVPDGPTVRATWRNAHKLKDGARRMFDALEAAYPNPLTRDELATQANITGTGGTFTTYLGHLRRMRLIDEDPGELVTLTSYLFPEDR